MTVLRIVANCHAENPQAQAAFYQDMFDLDIAMDNGFIVTLTSGQTMQPQLSLMSQGGAGTATPALSIEVDDVDGVHARAHAAACEITYPLTDEPWGVRRFFMRDPAGRTLNILSHKK